MEKKYIPYKVPTSLFGWRERWFYIGNYHPSLLERTTGHSGSVASGQWHAMT
jgi:hypothetical protein